MENKVTAPFSAPVGWYWLQSIDLHYQDTDVHNLRVTYSEDPLNQHTTV